MASVVSERYALSLYEVAKQENLVTEIYDTLGEISNIFTQYPEYLKVLTTPSIGFQQKKQSIVDVFEGKIHPYVLNFLLLLTEKRRIAMIHEIGQAYQDFYYLEEGICAVTAVTAIALDENQMEKLKNKMTSLTGKKIVLKNQVDSGVIGGVLVRIENKQMDDTLQTRLNQMAAQLSQIIA